jgi:hypothetical protein
MQIVELVRIHGEDDWQSIASHFAGRTARQCRERWAYYLSPSITNGPWSSEEDALLLEKFEAFGSTWNKMKSFFPGRTDINIKNRYRTLIRRRSSVFCCGTADHEPQAERQQGDPGDHEPPTLAPVQQAPPPPDDWELVPAWTTDPDNQSDWPLLESMTSFDFF